MTVAQSKSSADRILAELREIKSRIEELSTAIESSLDESIIIDRESEGRAIARTILGELSNYQAIGFCREVAASHTWKELDL